MKRYTVTAIVGISVSTVVEAESEEEALEIAEGRPMQHLPANDSANHETEWCHSGELDGRPVELMVEGGAA